VEAVFIIFCIITINFILIRFMPGDPVVHIIGEDEYLRLEAEAPEVIEEVRREYGLDKPLPGGWGGIVFGKAPCRSST